MHSPKTPISTRIGRFLMLNDAIRRVAHAVIGSEVRTRTSETCSSRSAGCSSVPGKRSDAERAWLGSDASRECTKWCDLEPGACVEYSGSALVRQRVTVGWQRRSTLCYPSESPCSRRDVLL